MDIEIYLTMKRKRNVFLIFGVASMMAVLVYLFTMGHRETLEKTAISYSKPPDNPKKDTLLLRAKARYYTIKAGDSPLGVCKKFGLTLDELNRLNSPMPPFNGGQRLIVGTLPEPGRVDTIVIKKVPELNSLRYERHTSKRMIMVIGAFLAGLVITSSLIILLQFLDTGIKFPGRFAELSGLKLIGAFPWIPAKPNNRINYPLISSRAIDLITQRIRLEDLGRKILGEQPFILFFISTRENEGKTYLATRVVEKLRASGSKVLYIKPLETNSTDEFKLQFNRFDQPLQAWDYEYAVPDNFISIRNINELLRNYTFLTKGYHYLVIELPALLVHEYPAMMTQSGHLSILVGHATRTWSKADEEAVKLFQSSIDHPVLALLNGCQVDQLKSVIGEIPKRSRLSFG
ncbi:MAG: hypothetical protein D4R64_05235 [Porphyromonadaceae bacterium]|nr:MAG: hypothetical protein D4R64_05235 [Porphyromonadaceae bacterium]